MLDQNGLPLRSAPVLLEGEGVFATGETDAAGKALFENLPDVELLVAAALPRHTELPPTIIVPSPLTVRPAGQQVALRCRQGVAIKGIALDAQGQPLAHAGVDVWTVSGEYFRGRADAFGRFAVAVPPGEKCSLGLRPRRGAAPDASTVVARDVTPEDGEITLRLPGDQ
ncbi:MAG: hypothetical protein AB1486_21410 [Planctomycetota bacterium]